MNRSLFLPLFLAATLIASFFPTSVLAAAGIAPSGGGSVQNGQTFTITVRASGATFDSLQGTISVSGPVSIVSFSAGAATWLPGKTPANNNQFVGIVSATSSLTVATIKLKGTKEGSGSVKVTGARLARNGAEVGSAGGTASFTITRALVPPGSITVTSASHPDQNAAYEATTAELSWDKPAGVTGYSTVFDQAADTTPAQSVTTTETGAKFEALAVGTYYFHIRALNGDGWGPTTHFKVTVKEPDPKVDETLSKATIATVSLGDGYVNDITAGTISNLTLGGTVETGYVANVTLLPKPALGAETKLSSEISTDGNWRLVIPDGIPAGFYTVTAQGQKEKSLTPASEPTMIQLSVAEGGSVRVITAGDAVKPPRTDIVKVLGLTVKKNTLGWISLLLANVLLIGGFLVWQRVRNRRLSRTSKQLS